MPNVMLNKLNKVCCVRVSISFLFLFFAIPPQWESMAALWTVHMETMKFGTFIGVVLN